MKKLKLSLSICMMCLCLAVLCMGILAVSSVSYQINGNISYNMIDGIALVNTRVYKIADQKTTTELETTATTLSTMTFEAIESSTDLGFILSQKLDTKATLSNGATSDEISAGSINIGFGATDSSVYYYTFYIVINITNLSSEGKLSATLTDNTTYTNVNNYILSSQTGISKGDTKNIVIGLSLSDTTVESVNIDMAYSLSIEFKNVGLFSVYIVDSAQMNWENVEFEIGQTWSEFIDTDDTYSGDVKVFQQNEEGTCVLVCNWANTKITLYYDTAYTNKVGLYDLVQAVTYYMPNGRHSSGGSK